MLFSTSQKYLKELLKEFGALTKVQAEKLMKMKYSKANKNEIHQLLLKKEIKEQDKYILDLNGKINFENIVALDVFLLISNKKAEVIQKGTKPFSVTFFKFKKDKLWRYDICIVKTGYEEVVTAALENINSKYRVIVFVLETPEQQENLFVPCECCFVWKENGEYHFYKEKR